MATTDPVASGSQTILPLQYRIDDLLTEHFGFAPKAFTGHAFDLINEAVFDTVTAVESASLDRFPSVSSDTLQTALHKLETLLCAAVDKHFDLFEIWLHRNIFALKGGEKVVDGIRLKHQWLWNTRFGQDEAEWEEKREEEKEAWDDLEEKKATWLQKRDEHQSLLAVDAALSRRLAALQTASSSLTNLTSQSHHTSTSTPSTLPSRIKLLLSQIDELLTAQEKLRRMEDEQVQSAGMVVQMEEGKLRSREGFVDWALGRKVEGELGGADMSEVKKEMAGVGSEETVTDIQSML